MDEFCINYYLLGVSLKRSLYGAGAEYALHSLVILASRVGPVSVRDLATFQQLPERFLAKLFTRLKKAKLVKGIEGIAGGFILARPANQIRVSDVLEAVDPNRIVFVCAEIRRNCILFEGKPSASSTSGMCQIHTVMRDAERSMREVLGAKTIAALVREVDKKVARDFVHKSEIWFNRRLAERTAKRSTEHA
jgi:Rrf2 family protein